ncbi:filamentous hemagglutinin N-terminal domain-containing protein [Salmonella enterica]|nr:filamentous hemagglutinin N-terminal domain-containing protein [Salmonella enterica]
MNKIYRLKFDKRRNELVVVSEIAAGTGKKKNTGHIADLCDASTFRKLVGTLTPLAFLTGLIISLFPVVALANPDLPAGGQIVDGQGSISTSGNQMTIHQNTQNMATNWHSFDIGQNNTVEFVQPDSSSVALNRVTGASGSQIMGTLKANGQVFILNPNGVLFGKDARVNVAGLVASTKNINTADFMKGRYTLSGEGNPGAQVINQGSLTTTKGGYIVLAADQVKNSGTITTLSGKTVLAAGRAVTLQLDNGGLTSVSVDGGVVNALVDNRGLISASNGQVYLTAKGRDMLLNTVVNNSGTIEAKGLESRGGEIVLNGGDSGVVSQSGQLLADSHAGPGGKITVEGQNIHLAANSLTSATGNTGGGEVYVGGGWQGKDGRIRNASKVVMDRTATVDVSATGAGNGGTAVLWSDDYTNFRGAILAKGGALSGDGGRVETSSYKNLQASGDVDASAPAGRGGEWLLDPLDVTIVSGSDNVSISETGKGTSGAGPDEDAAHIFSPSATDAQVSAKKIEEELNKGTSVTVDTHGGEGAQGNITIADSVKINKTTGGDATLTLKADKDITTVTTVTTTKNERVVGGVKVVNTVKTVNKVDITSKEGKLNLNLLAGSDGKSGKVSIGAYSDFSLNGGDFFVGPADESGGSVSLVLPDSGNVRADNITLNTRGGVSGTAYSLVADNNLTVTGPFALTGLDTIASNITAGGYLSITAGSGDISFSTAPVLFDKKGSFLIEGKKGVDIRADNGHLVIHAINRSAGKVKRNSINVSSAEGAVNLNATVTDTVRKQKAVDLTGVNITSADGIRLTGNNKGTGEVTGILLEDSSLNAGGSIAVNGTTPGSYSGVRIIDTEVSASGQEISIYGASTGRDGLSREAGSVYLGDSKFTSNKITVTGDNTGKEYFGSGVAIIDGNSFDGVVSIKGTGGIGIYISTALPGTPSSTLKFSNGNVLLSGISTIIPVNRNPGGTGTIFFEGVNSGKLYTFLLNKSDLTMYADNTIATDYSDAFNAYSWGLPWNNSGSVIFSGQGNVVVEGKTRTGAGVTTRIFDNTKLDGTFKVSGTSKTGVGVSFDNSNMNATLVNAIIEGESASGNGVVIQNTGDSTLVNLNKNTVKGTSETAAGIVINGKNKNVTITNGSLEGTTTSGTGAGISLNGGSDYTLDGVTVTGKSDGGSGVSAGGTLTVNNGTVVDGTSSGSGAGVTVSGDLITKAGDGVTLKGQSDSGDGVQVAGDTSLMNATVNGTSASGTGTNISGNLTVSGTSEIKGISVSETGLNIAKKVTVVNEPEPDSSRVTFTGISTEKTGVILGSSVEGGGITTVKGTSMSGDGVELAENAQVKQTTLEGSSTTGSGVNVTGDNVKLDSATAKTLAASSGSGSGLTLSEGADVHVVQSDDMTTPVTAAEILKGTSDSGSGVTVAGNAAVSGVILKGETTAENGTGVTLKGGKLTLSDELSGVEAGATGNGTALVLENAEVDAKGYRESAGEGGAKDYTLSAAVTGDGTAVKTVGKSTLTSVKLNATSTGNGSGLKVAGGTLASDREITASSSGEQGTAVVLNGGTLQGAGETPVVVKASASGDTGMAVKVEKAELSEGEGSSSSLKNINLQASSDKGTVLDVSGELSSDQDISVSTADGTALVLNGGGLTSADTTKPVTITASATGDTGTAVKVEKVKVDAPEGAPTGSSLKDINLKTSSTKGNALNVEGKLETQNTAITASATDTGTSLNISGGEIHSKGQTSLTAKADAGHAAVITGGKLTGEGNNPLMLTASTTSANTAVDIRGDSDISNSSVKGENKGTGTAVKQSGNTTMTNADVSGKATSGTGTEVTGTVELTNANVKGTSETGTGSQVATGAKVTSTGTSVLSGEATGTGKGTEVSGEISGGKVTGVATSGPALTLAEGAVVKDADVSGKAASGTGTEVTGTVELTNANVNGASESGRGSVISGSLTQDDTSSVSGNSEGEGTGMVLGRAASVSGGTLTATSVGGTGLEVEQGSQVTDVEINAQTVTGKAIAGEDNALTTNGKTSISTVGEPGNTNISGSVKPAPGGTPSGAVEEALVNKLRESIAALQNTLDTKLTGLTGLQQSMATLQAQFDQAVHTGAIGQADLKRLETAMNGLSDRLNTAAELKDAFSALKADTGSLEERLKKSDVLSTGLQGLTLPAAGDISAVAGELGAAKALQSATVSLQASLAARTEENGKVRLHLDSLKQRLKEAQEKGTAGGAVLAGIQAQLDVLERQQRSYGESLVHFQQSLVTVSQDDSRPVTGRQESVDGLQTALSGVSGISDRQVSALVGQLQRATAGYAQLVAVVQQQGSVNAQTPLQSQDQQDGFRAGGEPPVPVHGYQAQPQNVDIHLCDSDGCRLMTLDAIKPSQAAMAEVTESR